MAKPDEETDMTVWWGTVKSLRAIKHVYDELPEVKTKQNKTQNNNNKNPVDLGKGILQTEASNAAQMTACRGCLLRLIRSGHRSADTMRKREEEKFPSMDLGVLSSQQ